MAERKTRSEGGIDAVAVLAILSSTNASFPLSTIIIEQYRPPVGAYVIGTFLAFGYLVPSSINLANLGSDISLQNCPLVRPKMYGSIDVLTVGNEGLIDKGESPESTAIRELEEETGYKAEGVLDISPVMVCDPGTF